MSKTTQQLQILIPRLDEMASVAFDVHDYAQQVATALESVEGVQACEVVRQPNNAPYQILVSDDPYTAIVFTLATPIQTWPLLLLWGDSAVRSWKQFELQTSQAAILQRETAAVILRDVPVRSDVNTMLQTAADSIGQLLGASTVNIYFRPEDLSSSTQES